MSDAVGHEQAALDPVCGMTVNPATARHKLEHDGKTIYFCCGGCLEKFRAEPEKFLTQRPSGASTGLVTLGMSNAVLSAPMVPSALAVKDPVCGMEVDPRVATGKSVHKGQTYYFCAVGCKTRFDADPGKYLRK